METYGGKRWQVAPRVPEAFGSRVAPLHPLVIQVLYNRTDGDPEAVDTFLKPTTLLKDPFELDDVAEAVTLVHSALDQGRRMVVYSDYDADGVTSAAVLLETLQTIGAQVRAYIPSREDEGYGLNPEAIQDLADQGIRLLITTDCGIRSLDEIALARHLGMDVIVTDHHQAGPVLPQANAVLNPKRPSSSYPFNELAGVGVAFKLAQALIRQTSPVRCPSMQRELSEEDLLDLVALGTVADMAPLIGENHTLVALGLEKINSAQRPGLSALMRVAGVNPGKVTSRTIGFELAPRLNAAGRIDEATIALDLLLAEDMAEALPLAQALDHLNQKRREITLHVREKAMEIALAQTTAPPLVFAASEDFPSGVVGLAASRLLDEFYRPAVVVSIEGDYSKGSARSIPEFHITEALDAVGDLLVRYGGHRAAAGFTIRTGHLTELASRLVALAEEKLGAEALLPTLKVDAEVSLEMLSWDLHSALQRLAPFGYGNPLPIFVSRRVKVVQARAVGGQGRHLKLTVVDVSGRRWDAIAFRQGYWLDRLPGEIDLAYVLELNEWNGIINLQLNVQDIHFPGVDDPGSATAAW